MTLTEMRRLLNARGIQLTKSLGQNFLHDANQLRRIVEMAGVQPGDRVLEIGPGLGPLTGHLLAAGARVLAIETDARLVAVLRERFATALADPGDPLFRTEHKSAATRAEPALTLLHADALDIVRERRDWAGWKLVANLPYSVASPILVELALASRPPDRMVATLQWEVAQRLMSTAGTKDYGVLTLLVQLGFVPGVSSRIPAGCFFPPPDVESACLRLDRRVDALLPSDLVRFFQRVVKRAFSQRRKMMLKLLRADWDPQALTAAFAELGLPVTVRAEVVTLEQFVRLTMALAARAS